LQVHLRLGAPSLPWLRIYRYRNLISELNAAHTTVLSVTWMTGCEITLEHGKYRGSFILLLLWFSVVEICILKGEKSEEGRQRQRDPGSH